jgi:hypothetical protein
VREELLDGYLVVEVGHDLELPSTLAGSRADPRGLERGQRGRARGRVRLPGDGERHRRLHPRARALLWRLRPEGDAGARPSAGAHPAPTLLATAALDGAGRGRAHGADGARPDAGARSARGPGGARGDRLPLAPARSPPLRAAPVPRGIRARRPELPRGLGREGGGA